MNEMICLYMYVCICSVGDTLESILVGVTPEQKKYLESMGYGKRGEYLRMLIDKDINRTHPIPLNIDNLMAETSSTDTVEYFIEQYFALPKETRNKIYHSTLDQLKSMDRKNKLYKYYYYRHLYNEAVRQGVIKEAPPAPPEEKEG